MPTDPDQPDAALRCSLCGAGVDPGTACACGLCAAPHHPDCWEYTGMCSTYGCGGIAAVPYSRGLVPVRVAIDGSGVGGGLALRTAWSGLTRWGRQRARDLPATMLAGALGSLAATTSLAVLWAAVRGSWVLSVRGFWLHFFGPYAVVFTLAGLGFGLLSPFLAPLAHRRPALVASISGGTALAVYLSAARTGWAVVGLSGFLGIVAAATVGEWGLGPYRPLGRRLGLLAGPARFLFVGGFFFAFALAATVARGIGTTKLILAECLVWAILAAFGGLHALEVGKEEYRKHLVALVEGPDDDDDAPPGLPGPAPDV